MRWPSALVLAAAMAAPATAEPSGVAIARSSGLVGERFDGYIGVAGAVSPTVRSQVGTINITRRTLYTQLAARRGVTREEVALTAGCSLLAVTPVGGVYLLGDNEWRKRGEREPAPRPEYCR